MQQTHRTMLQYRCAGWFVLLWFTLFGKRFLRVVTDIRGCVFLNLFLHNSIQMNLIREINQNSKANLIRAFVG